MKIPNTNCTPEFLFKYRSLNDDLSLLRLKEIIIDKKLYFSRIEDFNDPFEFDHNLTFDAKNDDIKIKYIIEKINEDKEFYGDLLTCKSNEEMIKKYESKQPLSLMAQNNMHNIRKNLGLGVLCLSQSFENINLWSHYADSHKGVCIKFKLISNKANFFKVIYTSSPNISIYEQYYYEEIAKLKWDKFWNHEDEYRAISNIGQHSISDLGLEIESIYLGINFYDNPLALNFINEIEPIIESENIKIFNTEKNKNGKYSIDFKLIDIWFIKKFIEANNRVKLRFNSH